jgi:hypothetical protein
MAAQEPTHLRVWRCSSPAVAVQADDPIGFDAFSLRVEQDDAVSHIRYVDTMNVTPSGSSL